MEGVIKTKSLNIKDLESGMVTILNDKQSFEIVTLQHLNADGEWMLMGNKPEVYVQPIESTLCKLVIESNSKEYALKFNQWSQAIRNKEVDTGKIVTFELVPLKFKEGKHVCVCTRCTAYFLGASLRQYTCKACCNLDVTAKVLINKTVKQQIPSTSITIREARRFAILAYGLGTTGSSSEYFDEWLDKNMPCH